MSSEKEKQETTFIEQLIDNLEKRCIEKQDSLSIVSAVNDVMEILETERNRWRQIYIDAFELDYDSRDKVEVEASNQIAALDSLEISMRLFRATHLTYIKENSNAIR